MEEGDSSGSAARAFTAKKNLKKARPGLNRTGLRFTTLGPQVSNSYSTATHIIR
jgi:hypothetical protein